MEGSFVSSKIL